jgi:hypothetical protein
VLFKRGKDRRTDFKTTNISSKKINFVGTNFFRGVSVKTPASVKTTDYQSDPTIKHPESQNAFSKKTPGKTADT